MQGSLFELYFTLYVGNGALDFESITEAESGTNLIMLHYPKFGLEIHVGDTHKTSKTKRVLFSSPDHFKLIPLSLTPNLVKSQKLPLIPPKKAKIQDRRGKIECLTNKKR